MKEHIYFVYMMQSISRNALYTGICGDLRRRIWQHKNHVYEGFTDDNNCTRLVYFESWQDVNRAIAREKQIKRWSRKKKEVLIHKMNPEWKDLAVGWYETKGPSTQPQKARPRSG